jgi:hypothetical protein
VCVVDYNAPVIGKRATTRTHEQARRDDTRYNEAQQRNDAATRSAREMRNFVEGLSCPVGESGERNAFLLASH